MNAMQRGKRSSGSSEAQRVSDPALAALENLASENFSADQGCKELSKIFQVQATEVALFRLEEGCLKFLFPNQLSTAGSIPLSSSSTIAAHTAISKKSELYNNFSRVKHASIFETVKLGDAEDTPSKPPIQKLMSAPVLDAEGNVLGVIQICRKGFDPPSAGPDFTLDDLRQLERAAMVVGRAALMRKVRATSAK